MRVGYLIKMHINDEWDETGVVIEIDDRTCPEKVFIKTTDGRIVDGYGDECEVISAVG